MTRIHGSWHLGRYEDLINKAMAKLNADDVLERIFRKDHTVWKPDPAEIVNRLGWLQCPETTAGEMDHIRALVDSIRREGFTHTLLLGMGGSSLAPDVFQQIIGKDHTFPSLHVLDSTDPAVIADCENNLSKPHTLFIVSTKSGSTVETIDLFKYFYRLMVQHFGPTRAGWQFIAITDPGSAVEDIAHRYRFRDIFLNDPDIGGRYAALSLVGMVPAALAGIDIQRVLERASGTLREEAIARDGFCALRVGTILAELAQQGRNKATFLFSPGLAGFGGWIEQLIAESTGKEGRGILPVIGETLADPDCYGDDRLFIAIRWRGDLNGDDQLADLGAAGHPVIRIVVDDPYDLGSHCFFWELATAVAGHVLAINPFDQPDVESSKVQTRRLLAEYKDKGTLPGEKPFLATENADFYGQAVAGDPTGVLSRFLQQGKRGDYVGLQIFLPPSPLVDENVSHIRERIRNRFLLATASGYGPRYLHSTGQLHKGDQGRGLFIQFTAASDRDLPIPDSPDSSESAIGFDTLRNAQALGDIQALRQAGRRVIRIHLKDDIGKSLISIARMI